MSGGAYLGFGRVRCRCRTERGVGVFVNPCPVFLGGFV